jgi:hypothetical protein
MAAMDALLDLVPSAERSTVTANARHLARSNRAWALDRLGAAGPGLCDNLAVTVAAIAPALGPPDLEPLVRLCLWTFLIDDRLDDPGADPARLRAVGARVQAALDAPPAHTGDPVVDTLTEVFAPLAARCPGGALVGRLRDELRAATAAGVVHAVLSRRVARGRAEPPPAEEYLDLAGRHINYRSFAVALLIMLDGAVLDGPVLDGAAGREPLDRALEAAGRAVRLANDLRSVERHRREGNLNVLLLRHSDGTPVTRRAVQEEIERYARRHDASAAALGRPHGPALVNSLRVSVGLYRLGQLR